MWVVLFLFIASVYLRGIVPTIYFQDSAEFCASASCLGSCHPPGYPLWTLLSNALIRWVPFGEEAFRANLASAIPMALAAVLLGSCCRKVIRKRSPLAVVLAAAAAALGERAWFVAGVAEVHGLGLLLFCASLWVVLNDEGRPAAWMGLSLLAGLSLANHQSSGLLLLLMFLWSGGRCRGACLRFDRLVRAGALGLIGLAPYLFLAVAASREPPANWGDPSTWSRLVDHILRRQYGEVPPLPASAPVYLLLLKAYARDLLAQLPLPVLGLAAVGVLAVARSKPFLIPPLCCASTLLFLVLSGFEVAEWRPPIARLFYVPSFFLCSLLAGAGLAWFASKGGRRCWTAFLFLSVPWMALSSWIWNERRQDDLARRYGVACVRDVPRAGVLFTAGDNAVFTSRYLQQVEGIQEGVVLVSRSGLVSPSFRGSFREKHPRWDFPSETEVAILQEEEPDGETLRLSTGEREAPPWLSSLCERVVEGVPDGRAAGWELGGEDEALRDRLDSVGFVCLVREGPGRSPGGPGLLRRAGRYVEQVSRLGAGFYLKRDACFAYATKFNEAGVLEARRGFSEEALSLYETALFFNPRQATALANVAMARKNLDSNEDTLVLLEEAVSQNPLNLALLWTLCSEQVRLERFDEAKQGYERMLRLSPKLVGPLIGLCGLADRTEADPSWKARVRDRLLARVGEDEAAALIASKWALREEEWEVLDACAQAWPSHPAIRRRQAQALLGRGRTEPAITTLRNHVERFPEDAKGWQALGNALRRQGMLPEARSAYEKAYALGMTGTARNVGICLIEEGRLDAAEQWLLKAVEADAADAEAWVSLAAVRGRQGRLDEAEEACLRALEAEPGHKKGYLNWALIESTRGRTDNAVSILEKALEEVKPGDRPEVRETLRQYKDMMGSDSASVVIE